jgi:transketolase
MSNKQIRQEFADTMLEVGQKDSKLVVLVGDISHYSLQPFAKACPGRYYNIGICEPTMMSMAAGLSKRGFIPVVHTIAPFLLERSFEQIKDDFGYQKLGVNLVSVGAGFDYGTLGVTHHCYDDFALLKNIEGAQIFYPGSCKEFNKLFKQVYDLGFINYFRISETKHDVDLDDEQISLGKGVKVKEGEDVTIVVVGPQLRTAVDSSEALKRKKVSAEVIYLPTIKPFDDEIVRQSLSKTKRGLVIEEHSMYGGILEEVLRCSVGLNDVKFSSINLGDRFVRVYGSYKEQCRRLGFSIENIINKVERELI